MTIHLPDPNICDNILKIFGKKRGFIIPPNYVKQDKFGQYSTYKANRESFWAALLRPEVNNFQRILFLVVMKKIATKRNDL